jgi:hypothetical protein
VRGIGDSGEDVSEAQCAKVGGQWDPNADSADPEFTATGTGNQDDPLFSWIWAPPTPISYENDVPLSPTATAIFKQVYQNTWPIAQPLCSGGGFVYAGLKEGKKGIWHAEALAIPIEAETGKGISSGVLLEGGVGRKSLGGSVGVEGAYSWSTKSFDVSGLAFANKDIGGLSLGPVSVGGLADTHGNFGAYAGIGVGIGVYGRPSFINGCK